MWIETNIVSLLAGTDGNPMCGAVKLFDSPSAQPISLLGRSAGSDQTEHAAVVLRRAATVQTFIHREYVALCGLTW